MRFLELKIPPPIVALLIAALMWASTSFTPPLGVPELVRVIAAITIALIGGCFDFAGLIAFRRAKTTINPMNPKGASALVTSGIYQVSRNPMYVGLLFLLIAWAVSLSSALALLEPLAFVFYISKFQIKPEESVLSALFGEEYTAYKSKVRRWL